MSELLVQNFTLSLKVFFFFKSTIEYFCYFVTYNTHGPLAACIPILACFTLALDLVPYVTFLMHDLMTQKHTAGPETTEQPTVQLVLHF